MKSRILCYGIICCVVAVAAAQVSSSSERFGAVQSEEPVSTPPTQTFAGCGTLQWGPQSCLTFVADAGVSFFLENTGNFFPGAYVYVEGTVVSHSLLCWPVIGTALEDNTITAAFAGCGTLQRGPQTCVIFAADGGEFYLLEYTDGFVEGDSVYVTGPIVEDSLICEPFVGPAIERNTIQECYNGCGVLGHGPQSCTMFHGDDGRGFVLDEYGDFFIGDRVYVSGPILLDSLACWPVIVDKIEHNIITECSKD